MGVVQEALGAVRVVKAFGREDHEQQRFMRHSEEWLRSQLRVTWLEGRFDLLVGLTIALGTAATLVVGVQHVQAGALTVGSLLVIMAYLTQIYEPLKTMSKKIADLQSGLASANRAFVLLDQVQEVIERPHSRPLSGAVGAVEFRNVSFAYPGGPEVLRDISFTVKPGMRVGIAGQTGAGKTTLKNLLMRFYDPCRREILLDGFLSCQSTDYPTCENSLRWSCRIPFCFQPQFGKISPMQTLRQLTRKSVRSAKLANAHDFIMGLPEGYRTAVGERGVRFRGENVNGFH
jgi:ATP-binding cassette, subfamily B, bacterial